MTFVVMVVVVFATMKVTMFVLNSQTQVIAARWPPIIILPVEGADIQSETWHSLVVEANVTEGNWKAVFMVKVTWDTFDKQLALDGIECMETDTGITYKVFADGNAILFESPWRILSPGIFIESFSVKFSEDMVGNNYTANFWYEGAPFNIRP